MASIGRPDFLPASRLATPNGKKLTRHGHRFSHGTEWGKTVVRIGVHGTTDPSLCVFRAIRGQNSDRKTLNHREHRMHRVVESPRFRLEYADDRFVTPCIPCNPWSKLRLADFEPQRARSAQSGGKSVVRIGVQPNDRFVTLCIPCNPWSEIRSADLEPQRARSAQSGGESPRFGLEYSRTTGSSLCAFRAIRGQNSDRQTSNHRDAQNAQSGGGSVVRMGVRSCSSTEGATVPSGSTRTTDAEAY
jgi:hypothetical protein